MCIRDRQVTSSDRQICARWSGVEAARWAEEVIHAPCLVTLVGLDRDGGTTGKRQRQGSAGGHRESIQGVGIESEKWPESRAAIWIEDMRGVADGQTEWGFDDDLGPTELQPRLEVDSHVRQSGLVYVEPPPVVVPVTAFAINHAPMISRRLDPATDQFCTRRGHGTVISQPLRASRTAELWWMDGRPSITTAQVTVTWSQLFCWTNKETVVPET